VVATTTSEEEAAPGFRGGLLTTKDLRARLPTSQDRRKGDNGDDDDPEAMAAAQETVYRDASGRKIDMKVEKAEAARKKREREEREAQKMEWGKGLVQRGDAEKRRREEERIRLSGFTRYANDEELNRAQKDQERWNDPAAAFMTVRFLLSHMLSNFCADTFATSSTEKENKGPSEARIHRSDASPESVRNQAWI
jgi:pre-mRNA-splicing factor CWC26